MTLDDFKWIADVLPEPMMLVTVRGKVIAANQSLRQILGPGFVVCRQNDISEIFKTTEEKIREYLKLCSGVRQFLPGPFKLHFSSGTELDLQCEGAGIDSSNFPEQVILLRLKAGAAGGEQFRAMNEQIDALNTEIGKRIKAEESNQWMLAVLESSEDAIISKDLNGIIISCNQGASRLFGYRPEELVGKAMTILIPSDHPYEEKEILARMRRGEQIEHFETVRRRKDGSMVAVSLTISPVKDPHGKIVGVSNIARDITERRRSEEIMRQQASLFDQAYDAIFVWQWKGAITFWNRGAERLYGFGRTEALGQVSHKLLRTQTACGMHTLLLELESQGQWEGELEHVARDGRDINVETRMVLVRAPGTADYVLEVNRDMTARKHDQQQLEESFRREKAAREFAEKANLAKDDFLASLSLELRTPLNPVLLIASDAADNRDLPVEIRNDFETILKNIELEARLIDDLLDLTHITHGKLSLRCRDVDARIVLREAIANIQSSVDAKQIQMSFNWSAEHSIVHADAVRLKQVFWNVLKNAVKFTPPNGKIAIEATVTNGLLSVSFTDTGIGMTQEEIGRIFDAFAQGDHGNESHRFGGLGLGLAISRRLVELHLGQIYARSAGRDKGSTFIIELPTAKTETIHSVLNENSNSNAVMFPTERSARIFIG